MLLISKTRINFLRTGRIYLPLIIRLIFAINECMELWSIFGIVRFFDHLNIKTIQRSPLRGIWRLATNSMNINPDDIYRWKRTKKLPILSYESVGNWYSQTILQGPVIIYSNEIIGTCLGGSAETALERVQRLLFWNVPRWVCWDCVFKLLSSWHHSTWPLGTAALDNLAPHHLTT